MFKIKFYIKGVKLHYKCNNNINNKNNHWAPKAYFPNRVILFMGQTAVGVLPATLKHFIISNWGDKHMLDSKWSSEVMLQCSLVIRKKKCSLPDEASPEGTVLLSHTPSFSSLSRISQLNIPGFSLLYSSIRFSTSGVATCFRFEVVWRQGEKKIGTKGGKGKKIQTILI